MILFLIVVLLIAAFVFQSTGAIAIIGILSFLILPFIVWLALFMLGVPLTWWSLVLSEAAVFAAAAFMVSKNLQAIDEAGRQKTLWQYKKALITRRPEELANAEKELRKHRLKKIPRRAPPGPFWRV